MKIPQKPWLTILLAGVALTIGFLAKAYLARQPAPPISLSEVREIYGEDLKYIEVAGVELAYLDEGKDSEGSLEKQTVVLLHGSFGSVHMFDDLAEHLKKNYRVLRYDQPPSGLSGPVPPNFSLSSENFLDRFLTKLGIESVILVGTSSGGIIAYRYAAAYPEKTDALVLSNVPPSAPVDNAGARARLPFVLRHSLGACIKMSRPFSKTCWRDFLISNYERTNRVTDTLAQRYYDLNRRKGSLQYTSMTAIMREDDEVKRLLSSVIAPTALIWGDVDPVLPKHTAELMSSRMTNTRPSIYWLDKVSHYPPMEAPVLFGEALDTFLSDLN